MNFLVPAMLAALAAVAVPIVLHLLQRERHEVVEFPSLMFLRRIPQESVQRRRVQHWLLLAARCLLLALVVAAFARPFLRGRAAEALARDGAREVVVLLDRSYSMGYGDQWTRAQEAVRRTLDGLEGNDRATLVLFDETADAPAPPTTDRALLRGLVDGARPGAGATRYGPALRLAQGVLDDSDRARREVVVVSDFRGGGWDGAPDVRLPAGTALRRVDVGSEATTNASVLNVELARDGGDPEGAGAPGERVTVVARVRNHAPEPVAGRAVSLEVNDRVLQTVSVDLPASGTAAVRFAPVALPPDAARGVVRLAGDALPADDVHHFVATRMQERAVLVLESADAPAATSLYLTRALSLARDPAYTVTVRRPGAVRVADVERASLVILNDAAPPTGDVGRAIAAFVERGGGLLVALGERSGRWSGPVAELVPLSLGDVRDRRDATAASLGYVDRTHPVFAPFRTARGGDFAAARILRYRELRPTEGATVLARHGDGSAALAEVTAGRGRVLVWTSALDNRWSDLPVQPVFLPLVHELARHAAGGAGVGAAVRVGERVDAPAQLAAFDGAVAGRGDAAGAATGEWLAIAPSGDRVRLGGDTVQAFAPREAGFWQLRALDGDTRPRPLAVNVDPAEGDLARLDTATFVVATAEPGAATTAASVGATTAVEEEGRQSLWWYLLAGAMLLLGVEAAYANRLSVRTR